MTQSASAPPSSPPPTGPKLRPEHQVIPVELPFEHVDLPAVEGHIGTELEDFRVSEIPLYEPSGEGEHLFLRLSKRGATTAELVDEVARVAGVKARDIGYAGMKDKHAVTEQWLSVPAGFQGEPEQWQLPASMKLIRQARHGNKLRLGHLKGNRFVIRVTNGHPDGLARAEALCERIASAGVGNYFGPQRFGVEGKNLGSALYGLDRGRLNRRGGNRARFLASVIQSEHFNRVARARLADASNSIDVGDVARIEGSRAVFLVEDPQAEQPRLDRKEIHLTGPMIGPKMKAAGGKMAEIESEAARDLGLDEQALASLAPIAPGTRRDLRVYPTNLSVVAGPEGSLVFEFELPAGSYASLVIRTFTRGGPWAER